MIVPVTQPRGGTVVPVVAAAAGERLDKWLAEASRLGSRRRATEALLHGRVWVNEVEMTLRNAARPLAAGDAVRIWIDRPGSANRLGPRRSAGLDIVYEDADVLVLNKPAGLLSVPLPKGRDGESLADRVARHWRSHQGREALPVHRLDRDTSGLVVFARSPRAQGRLRDQFASRTPERVYLAIVYGAPDPPTGEWRTWLRWDPAAHVQHVATARTVGVHEARSTYRVIESIDEGRAALVEVRLITGKRHQIRAQAWLAGHPLVGERVYTGDPAPAPAQPVAFARQALHAQKLGFAHPISGSPLRFELPLPYDMRQLLGMLRGTSPGVEERARPARPSPVSRPGRRPRKT